MPRRIVIYCAFRARFDTSPRYSGSHVTSPRRPLDRIGREHAFFQDGAWRCGYCGARVAVAW